jgi:hypothetical protein
MGLGSNLWPQHSQSVHAWIALVPGPKDFRRVATHYDRKATHFLAAICLVAIFSYWL